MVLQLLLRGRLVGRLMLRGRMRQGMRRSSFTRRLLRDSRKGCNDGRGGGACLRRGRNHMLGRSRRRNFYGCLTLLRLTRLVLHHHDWGVSAAR